MSYGTFTPYQAYYAIDSEYLKSLISSKAYDEDDCELNESVSFSPRGDAFPAKLTGVASPSLGRPPPPAATPSSPLLPNGFHRQDSGLGRSYNVFGYRSINNDVLVKNTNKNGCSPQVQRKELNSPFFAECEQQVSKLFSFMEVQLSHIEQQINTAMSSKQMRHSKRIRRHYTSLSGSDGHSLPTSLRSGEPGIVQGGCSINDDMVEQNLLDDEDGLASDSGIEDRDKDFEELGLFSMDRDQANIENSISVLSRLKEIITNLQESLNNSFASLDNLLGMHDDRMLSQEGQEYLDTVTAKRGDYNRRISDCLDDVNTGLHDLYHEKEIRIDGLGRVRSHVESKINVQVRKSPVGCMTFLLGTLFALILIVVSVMYVWDRTNRWTVYLRLVRGPLLVLLCIYLFGINMKTWALSKIDYVSIFEYNRKSTPTPRYVFKVACILTVFFTALIVALLVASAYTRKVPGRVVSIFMWLTLLLFLVNPFDILLRRARFSFILVCVRILIAPFHFVYFGDFFLADQLNSTVAIMLDIQYLICYSISQPWTGVSNEKICTSSGNGIRPIISCLPSLWRLLQCLRCFYDTRKVKHLINAVKYFTTFPVVILATLFSVRVKANSFSFSLTKLDLADVGWIIILWMFFSILHSMYTFVWDVYCDWGLWSCSNRSCLRPYLVYRYKILYHLAIVFDMLLRFAWTAKLTLAIVWHVDSDLIYTCKEW